MNDITSITEQACPTMHREKQRAYVPGVRQPWIKNLLASPDAAVRITPSARRTA